MDTSPILPLQKIRSTSPLNRMKAWKLFYLCLILTGVLIVWVLHHYSNNLIVRWGDREALLLKRLYLLSQMKKKNFLLSRDFDNYFEQELLFQTVSSYFPQPRTIYTKSKSINFRADVRKFLHPSASKCGKKGELTYYIKSHYSRGYPRRKFIRETWGESLSVKFLVAGTVNDSMVPDFNSSDLIVLASIPESFDNISYKVGAALLHAHKCQTPMFMMDDDVLISPERIQFLHLNDTNKNPIFVGNLLELSIPLRNPVRIKDRR